MIVTIDGPSGSGKSTTASALAERLGMTYLDTGAMYRAVTWAVLERGADPSDEETVTRIAEEADISIESGGSRTAVLLDGRRLDRELRGPEVSSAVSPVSSYPGVRRVMVRIQRGIGRRGGIIAEGRDTGSTVFPFAHVKVFLVADIDERAGRRVRQLEKMGMKGSIGEIRENLADRDRMDSGRSHSPLVRPPGSILVDTSEITIDRQVSVIEERVRSEAARLSEAWSAGRRGKGPSRMRLHYLFAHTLLRCLFRLLFGMRVLGRDNARFPENCIFASNHLSYVDPPLVGSALDREVWYVAKRELFRNRLFGRIIRYFHAIPINRAMFDRSTVRALEELVENGESVLMFPEGTRSRSGELGKIKTGVCMIALRTGRPVVPVYLSNTDRLSDCFLRRKRLEVRIGPPIWTGDGYTPEDRKEDYSVLASMITEELRMLKDEAGS